MTTLILSLIVFAVIVTALGLWIGIPIILRWLADRGYFWIRVPEMHAAFILKDKKLHKIIISCSSEEKLISLKQTIINKDSLFNLLYAHFEDSEKVTSEDITKWIHDESHHDIDKKYFFVNKAKLIWIGLPWLGYEVDSWYEKSKDDDDPNADPHYILYLGERTWDYTTPESAPEEEKKAFISEWGVDTKDPIQVTPKLVATAEIMHPQKSVYDVKYYQEAIQKEVLAGWKYAVQELEYFSYEEKTEATPSNGDGESKKTKVTEGVELLQPNAQKKLNKFLFRYEEMEKEITPDEYPDESPARMIYEVYGIWLKRVRIRDIDPTDPKIRENLQAKLKAQTEAAANVEKSKGKRDSTVIEADGKIYETEKVGKAEADVIHMKLAAKGAGLKEISEKLDIKDADSNMILYVAQMATQMTENSQYTYLQGMPGEVSSSILAAADIMKGGMQKIKEGANGEAKIGFKEIKKAYSDLSSDEQKQLLELAQKTKDAEKEGKEGEEK